MSSTDPTKNRGELMCSRNHYAVPASYKMPAVLLIYTVKSANGLFSYKRTENINVKSERSFDILIFCSGQPDCDDNLIIQCTGHKLYIYNLLVEKCNLYLLVMLIYSY